MSALEQARAFHRQGKLTEAASIYAAVAREDPTNPEAGLAIAQWYLAKGNTQMALDLVDPLIRLIPTEPTLMALKGAILLRMGEQDRAEAWLVRSVETAFRQGRPLAQGWGYLAQAASRKGRWDHAIGLLKHALQIDANEVTSRYNLGLCYLRRGKWRRGWSYYEDRWQTVGHQATHHRTSPGKRWKGEALCPNDTIMVQAEQGQGDTFQFVRYLPLLQSMTGARIFFEYGRPEMRSLLELNREALGIERLCHNGDLVADTDWHVPLLSLPFCLKLDAPITPSPYLTPRYDRVRGEGPLRVGYVWAGSPGHTNDDVRSTRPEQWAEVLGVQGVVFVDLQVGRGGTFQPGSWLDTANALRDIDLLIAVDTGIVHLAGAIGVPTWVLIPYQNDWRWGESGATTPWYESVTIYRQPDLGDWESVMSAVARDLSTRVLLTHTSKESSV